MRWLSSLQMNCAQVRVLLILDEAGMSHEFLAEDTNAWGAASRSRRECIFAVRLRLDRRGGRRGARATGEERGFIAWAG
jgi:hypothetical protein